MYLFIDTETAGLDPTKSAILSLAGIVADQDFIIQSSFHFCIKPDLIRFPVVSEQALVVNGLSIADLVEYGYDTHEVKEHVLQILNGKKFTLVGWNVRFDRGFIAQMLDDSLFAHRRDKEILCIVR